MTPAGGTDVVNDVEFDIDSGSDLLDSAGQRLPSLAAPIRHSSP